MNRALEIAQEIKYQLRVGDNMRFFSWGASDFIYNDDIENGEVFLMFQVNGAIFQGQVKVTLLLGFDYYRVELLQNHQVVKSFEPVYCDNLAELIDEQIEKPSNIASRPEYNKFLQKQNVNFLIFS